MSKFLVGVLTTIDAQKAKRCVDSIQCKDVDIIVIVNSFDPNYLKQVEESCVGHTVIQTDCNGTPGQGKNSVLDYFIQSNAEYLFPIDGDDYYIVGGVKQLIRYINVLEPDDVPDVLGQLENKLTYEGKETTWEEFSKIIPSSTFATKSRKNWRILKQLNKLAEDILPFNRFLVLSSHAAKSFRYNEKLKAADDVLASFELYSQTPEINYLLLRGKSLYHYDLHDEGTLHSFVSEDNTENMKPFFKTVSSLDFTGSCTTMIE